MKIISLSKILVYCSSLDLHKEKTTEIISILQNRHSPGEKKKKGILKIYKNI